MEYFNSSGAAEASSVPIVDFAGWTHGDKSQRKKIADQLVIACRDVGFVYIVNHNVPRNKISDIFAWSKKLFDLDREKKMLAPHPPGGAIHRGYSWPGLEKISQTYGDEDDPDLVKKLRSVSDVKVLLPIRPRLHSLSDMRRRATKSVVNRIVSSRISGYRKRSYLVSAIS